jgi:predicted DCC family thiol-disulfide oxidoreductase YuxK
MQNLNPDQEKSIILFDGVCNLCSRAVQFVLRWEKDDEFRFAALQSDFGLETLKNMKIDHVPDSIVLLEEGKVYFQSDAALRISKKLKFPINLLYLLKVLPSFLRNPVYNWIAKNRYSWFGKKKECWIPDKSYSMKFIHIDQTN